MKKLIILLTLCSVLCALCSGALAAGLERGIVTSGGQIAVDIGGYKLSDIKGFSPTGIYDYGSYKIIPGIFVVGPAVAALDALDLATAPEIPTAYLEKDSSVSVAYTIYDRGESTRGFTCSLRKEEAVDWLTLATPVVAREGYIGAATAFSATAVGREPGLYEAPVILSEAYSPDKEVVFRMLVLDPVKVPKHCVPLRIRKGNNDIVLSWDDYTGNMLNIYSLEGNGLGQFDNYGEVGREWLDISDQLVWLDAEGNEVERSNAKQARHPEVINSKKEIYYKSLLAKNENGFNVDPYAADEELGELPESVKARGELPGQVEENDYKSYIHAALAVGMIKLDLKKDQQEILSVPFSFIPIPLPPEGYDGTLNNLDGVFGVGDPLKKGDKVFQKKKWNYSYKDPVYEVAVYDPARKQESPWRNAFRSGKESLIIFHPYSGYSILAGSDKTLAFVGYVPPEDRETEDIEQGDVKLLSPLIPTERTLEEIIDPLSVGKGDEVVIIPAIPGQPRITIKWDGDKWQVNGEAYKGLIKPKQGFFFIKRSAGAKKLKLKKAE